MIRLGCFLLFLVYAFVAVQGNDGKELPVPISDVMERLVDLEKRLLVQEQKNVDLENRLVDQERLNQIQMEIIRDLSTCDCKSKGKEAIFSGDDRNDSSEELYHAVVKSKTADEGFTANTTTSESQTKGGFFQQPIRESSTRQFFLGQMDATSKSKRDLTGRVAFYAYMSHNEVSVGPHQTFVFDNVVTDVKGNYNGKTGIFTSSSQGVYVFSWTLYCQPGGYFYSEVVANSKVVGSFYCNAQGAGNIRHISGVVVIEINQGDVVFVRTHPTNSHYGVVYSSDVIRSSFSGWKLF